MMHNVLHKFFRGDRTKIDEFNDLCTRLSNNKNRENPENENPENSKRLKFSLRFILRRKYERLVREIQAELRKENSNKIALMQERVQLDDQWQKIQAKLNDGEF